MLRANYWGIGMFVAGGLLAGLGSLVFKWAAPPCLLAWASV
jgi:hypothetical protein